MATQKANVHCHASWEPTKNTCARPCQQALGLSVFSNSRKACFLGLTETMELFHHLFRLRKQGWPVATALGAKPRATEIRRCAILNASDRGIQMGLAMSSNEQKMQILNES